MTLLTVYVESMQKIFCGNRIWRNGT